ncbi:TadE/TadG family type IV pilus assembly protein [Roseomonas elaeocarpi]|uniref:TadE/TadG family type IV pilus assembly protein n=1 Tax=Roseomonas elaeocarpi TaxID=907779 RepID=A0ABV6JS54_9PROT
MPWRRRIGRRGIAAVEFALVAPVMILLLLGGFDLANAFAQSMRLQSAAQAGAQYAAAYPTADSDIVAAVRANLAGWSNVTVNNPVRSCVCDNGGTVNCSGGSCASGTALPVLYLTITATRPFTASSPLTARLFPSLTQVSGRVQMRLR